MTVRNFTPVRVGLVRRGNWTLFRVDFEGGPVCWHVVGGKSTHIFYERGDADAFFRGQT